MGKELTPEEMVVILKGKADETIDSGDFTKLDLLSLADFIRSDLLGLNRCHASFFLKDPQEAIDAEIRYRNLFTNLTGIDSRNCDLATKK